MLKWNGFYLSDHTRVIEQELAEEQAIYDRRRLVRQSFEEIGSILMQAQLKSRPVLVQLADEDADHRLKADILGELKGYTDTTIVVGDEQIAYDDIWHVEIIS
jgi:soluble P-type ATPase